MKKILEEINADQVKLELINTGEQTLKSLLNYTLVFELEIENKHSDMYPHVRDAAWCTFFIES